MPKRVELNGPVEPSVFGAYLRAIRAKVPSGCATQMFNRLETTSQADLPLVVSYNAVHELHAEKPWTAEHFDNCAGRLNKAIRGVQQADSDIASALSVAGVDAGGLVPLLCPVARSAAIPTRCV